MRDGARAAPEEPRDEASRRVHAQYSTEERLEARRSVWLPTTDGRHPTCEALNAIRHAHPSRVLEIGCGTGEFAARLVDAFPETRVTAVDTSPRMVELASMRGLAARVADVQELPFADESFDVVAALWVLYHVRDLERGLDEIRRVLRPGGTLVAITNGEGHLADLRREAGGEPLETSFSTQNGEDLLRRHHFPDVHAEEFATRAFFSDRDAAQAYLESFDEDVEWRLPEFDGPREFTGQVTLFTAR